MQIDAASQPLIYVVAWLVLVAVVFAGAIWKALRDLRRARMAAAALAAREIAVIEETVRSTGFGAVCIVLLLIVIAASGVGYTKAVTVFQQIEIGVGFIGSLIVLGLGAALGRRRSYTVYRSEQRESD